MNAFTNGQATLRMAKLSLEAFAILLAVSGVLWFVYLAYFDTAPPFTSTRVYLTDTREVISDKFKAGDTVFVYRDLCFDHDSPVRFGRSLQSIDRTPPLNISINSTNGMMKKGCVPNANVIQIPPHTPPGLYRYSAIAQYSNNAFHDGATELPAPVLEVVQ